MQTTFTTDAFLSGDGMQTNIWGPPMWFSIHLMSFNYPVQPTEADQNAYATWLQALGNVLPCRHCRENFARNMREAGWDKRDNRRRRIALLGRPQFSKFCYDLHSKVNSQTECLLKNKTRDQPTYEQTQSFYESFRASCTVVCKNTAKEEGCEWPEKNRFKSRSCLRVVPVSNTSMPTICIEQSCCPLRNCATKTLQQAQRSDQ